MGARRWPCFLFLREGGSEDKSENKADSSLRKPTRSQEVNAKTKASACFARNDSFNCARKRRGGQGSRVSGRGGFGLGRRRRCEIASGWRCLRGGMWSG